MAVEPKIIWTSEGATVWHAHIGQGDDADFWPLLSDSEQVRAGAYGSASYRRRFVIRRGLLRRILSSIVDVDPRLLVIATEPSGKPWLPDGMGHISIAFSNEEAVFGFSRDRPIGVDIERIDADLDYKGLIADHFSAAERSEFHSVSPEYRRLAFFRAWSRKEACAKAVGVGLKQSLSRYEVGVSRTDSQKLMIEDGTILHLFDLPPPVWFQAAVALVHRAD